MRFPEFIWAPSLKDASSVIAVRRNVTRATTAAAAVTVGQTVVANIPIDQVLIVTSLQGFAFPGAAQNATSIGYRITDDAGNILTEIVTEIDAGRTGVGNNTSMVLNWSGEVMMFGGERLLGSSTFDAGAVANSFTTGSHGYVVPRGNLQR